METTTVTRAYRVALDPTKAQREALASHAGAARTAYNYRLNVLMEAHKAHNRAVAEATYLTFPDLAPAAALTAAKKHVKDNAATPEYTAYEAQLEEWKATDYAHMSKMGASQQAAKRWRREYGDPPIKGTTEPVSTTEARFKAEHPWASEVVVSVIQGGMGDAKTAFSNWIDSLTGKRAGPRMGYPRFHAKGKSRDSFKLIHNTKKPTLRPDGYRRLNLPDKVGGSIRLHGNLRHLARAITKGTATIQSVTISRGGKHWYASVLASETISLPDGPTRAQTRSGPVGVDMGVKVLAALSTGEIIDNPKHHKRAAKRLTKAQNALARTSWRDPDTGALIRNEDKRRGMRLEPTTGRKRAQLRLARAHAELAEQRAATAHRFTKRLATRHAVVAIEDLNVSGMTRSAKGDAESPGKNVRAKSGLNREILAVAFGEMRRQLEYKTGWYGSKLALAPRFAPTSKTCSNCGEVKAKLALSERKFHCTTCGYTEDRDVNAARNILAVATIAPNDACGKQKGPNKGPRESKNAPGGPRAAPAAARGPANGVGPEPVRVSATVIGETGHSSPPA